MNAKIFLVFILLSCGCVQVNTAVEEEVSVVEVVDGDTLKVLRDSGRETVRLAGIDTPEVHGENKPYAFEGVPDSREGRDCLRKYGENASAFMKQYRGEKMVLEYEKGLMADTRGSYGRLLGEVYIENNSINEELVRRGLARSYSEEGKFFDLEVEAKLDENGVWKCQGVS